MIVDADSNQLWLSEKLKERSPFFTELASLLDRNSMYFGWLPLTKDIWAVDYMPIQVSVNKFVQFVYSPDYLQPRRFRHLLTDPEPVCHSIGIQPLRVPLKVDGGDVIRARNWVILTDKVFTENPGRSRAEVLRLLEGTLEAKPIIIPREPGDFTGHADGILRMYDDETVLVNDYPADYEPNFQQELYSVLKREGLKSIRVPYAVKERPNSDDVSGLYINFLQMKDLLLVPTFGIPEDEPTLEVFRSLFPGSKVDSMESTAIAADGGVLNCISWNVFV